MTSASVLDWGFFGSNCTPVAADECVSIGADVDAAKGGAVTACLCGGDTDYQDKAMDNALDSACALLQTPWYNGTNDDATDLQLAAACKSWLETFSAADDAVFDGYQLELQVNSGDTNCGITSGGCTGGAGLGAKAEQAVWCITVTDPDADADAQRVGGFCFLPGGAFGNASATGKAIGYSTTSADTAAAATFTGITAADWGFWLTNNAVSSPTQLFSVYTFLPSEADSYSTVPRLQAGYTATTRYTSDSVAAATWEGVGSATELKGAMAGVATAAAVVLATSALAF
jgi:hypothetical protein